MEGTRPHAADSGRPEGGALLTALRSGAWADPLAGAHARDWSWRRGPVVVVLAVAVLLGGGWYLYGHAMRPPAPPPASTPAGPGNASTVRPTGTARPAPLLRVHVAGAVVRPGVVALGGGARVVDALAAAGGPRHDADVDRLNLAAKVSDGQRIAVPVMGAPPPPLVADVAHPSGGESGSDAGPPARIDLNTATATDLESLPGIGPVLAEAILAHRARLGRFRAVEDLLGVRGIGERRFAELRDRVRV